MSPTASGAEGALAGPGEHASVPSARWRSHRDRGRPVLWVVAAAEVREA